MPSRLNNRGFALIISYLVLALFFAYSNALTLGTLTQRQAVDRLRERDQALDLAQAAAEQLRQELYDFLAIPVYSREYQGDAVKALQWFDSLGAVLKNPALHEQDDLKFDLPTADTNGDGRLTEDDVVDGVRDATSEANARALLNGPGPDLRYGTADDTGLPTGNAANPPKAWLVSVTSNAQGEDANHNGALDPGEDLNGNGVLDPPDALAPRLVTIESLATVGNTTKRIRATYQIALGMSDIFRYAYFLNNYGWFQTVDPAAVNIFGEVRSNGDLDIGTAPTWNIMMMGDLYASDNPEVINPRTGNPSDGLITGSPASDSVLSNWGWKRPQSRPNRKLTLDGQPPIGGTPTVLPYGQGWDSSGPISPIFGRPEQARFEHQPVLPIPYLGDLGFYKRRAAERASTLTYNAPGLDGKYGTADDVPTTMSQVYAGPDGTSGTSDDRQPLVLYGTLTKPIILNGPVVIPGDVIIRGYVTGRGSIYAGRNVHITGEVLYKNATTWPSIERLESADPATNGQLRQLGGQLAPQKNLGYVCRSGAYHAPSAGGCAP